MSILVPKGALYGDLESKEKVPAARHVEASQLHGESCSARDFFTQNVLASEE